MSRATVGSAPTGMPQPASVAAESVLGKSARLAFIQPTQRSNDPWLRATMLTPNASEYITVMRLGRFDARQLREFLREPQTPVVAMSFSADPNDGMRTDSFTGHAVVFLATVNARKAVVARRNFFIFRVPRTYGQRSRRAATSRSSWARERSRRNGPISRVGSSPLRAHVRARSSLPKRGSQRRER